MPRSKSGKSGQAGMSAKERRVRLAAGPSGSTGRRYTWHGEGGGIDVRRVVQSYTSNTAKHDQELRYCEFSQLGAASRIRIMVTTTALSTGLNIPGIGILAQWKFPITKDLEDTVQRLGRVGRLPDLNGLAFLFLPYYIDDNTASHLRRSQGEGGERIKCRPVSVMSSFQGKIRGA